MVRATAIKLVTAALVFAEWLWLGEAVRPWAIAATLAAFAGLVAWAIVSPRAQLFVRSIYLLPPGVDGVAFTFDDGPDPVTTPRVLDLLARAGAKATFFLVGERAERYPELARRILTEGHAIGSHTYAHAHTFHFGSPRRQWREVARGIDAVRAAAGRTPVLFRPPQGLRTPMLRDALVGRGLVCVTWTERGLDAIGRPADRIVQRIAPALQRGAIVTLHDGAGLGGTTDRSPTLEALAELLEVARRRGLPCVSLERLEGTAR